MRAFSLSMIALALERLSSLCQLKTSYAIRSCDFSGPVVRITLSDVQHYRHLFCYRSPKDHPAPLVSSRPPVSAAAEYFDGNS